MRDHHLQRIRSLFEDKQRGTRVFEGLLLPYNLQVAIKDQTFSSPEDATAAVEEALTQTSLSNEPHIARVYGVCMSEQNGEIVVSIAVELFSRSLMDEIEERRNEGKHWSEQELWLWLGQIVSTLDRAQQRGFCHRDIKPQNLFLSKDGNIKIGDFGSSKIIKPGFSHTICGTPYFLSPLLKRALMESINSPFPQHADHDAFKSDVYSLGLTLLLMAQLKTNELMIKLDRLSQGATEAVADLPYSDQFKIVIHNMLQEDESNRPDFTQLNQVLQQGIPRPSEATTQASLYHTSIQDPYALIESLNVDPQDPLKLRALFERTGSVHAKIEITLRCSICLQEFILDVTCGCPNDVRIIFCSEECFSRSVAQPLLEVPSPVIASPLHELQESMKQSFHDLRKENLCIACQHRVVEVRELLLCKKCSEGQKREMERINCDECAQCLRKWPKQSMLSKLFQRKKVKSFQLPCKHTVCSAKCLADAAKHRQECPKCRHPIPNRLILSFKP